MSSPSSAPTADPDVAEDFLERFIAEDVQCEMGGVQASSRISPNVNVGPDCYTDELLAGASEVLTEALEDGHRSVRCVRPHARRGRERQRSGPA